MKKSILFILLLLSLFNLHNLNASFLYDKDTPVCIEQWYQDGSYIYYLESEDGEWHKTSENNSINEIHAGYRYIEDNATCVPEPYLMLGMDVKDWNFLMALTGLLFGLVVLVSSIYLFLTIGGKR